MHSSARLDLAEDVPRLLAAQATLHSRVRDRALRLEIDWERNEVRWSGDLDRDAPARQPLAGTPATGTSLNLMLALAARRLAPGEEVRYALLERGRQRGVAYRAGHREAVEVPAGRFEAVPMQRQDDARRRTTTAWFDPYLPPAPVRMLQSESGKARYELRLLRIEPLQAPADAS
ncbi:MAG: hypothetical protein KatS3mg126_0143 [Lysobacteraceae bacterium]|nr:MAG: hypothetical protein KatS3mg126_0143 [Xanthomonadaceae bacterium]